MSKNLIGFWSDAMLRFPPLLLLVEVKSRLNDMRRFGTLVECCCAVNV